MKLGDTLAAWMQHCRYNSTVFLYDANLKKKKSLEMSPYDTAVVYSSHLPPQYVNSGHGY